jgi:hypothetical protein
MNTEMDYEMDCDDEIKDEPIEIRLSKLDYYDNYKQLEILREEIFYILDNDLQPHEQWYQERITKVHLYMDLGWAKLYSKFINKDDYIYYTAYRIESNINSILEDWSTQPCFNLSTYYQVLEDIDNIWKYYNDKYVGDEDESDIVDLIEDLTHL